VKSNINTVRTADINFSCLLCLRRQRLQKIDISNTVAFLGYFDYIINVHYPLYATNIKKDAII